MECTAVCVEYDCIRDFLVFQIPKRGKGIAGPGEVITVPRRRSRVYEKVRRLYVSVSSGKV